MNATKFDLPNIPELNGLPEDVKDGICFRAASDQHLMRRIAYFPETIKKWAGYGSVVALIGCWYLLVREGFAAWSVVGFVCLPLALIGGEYLSIRSRYRQRALQFRDEYLAGEFDAVGYYQSRMTKRNPDPRLPPRPLRFFYDPLPLLMVQVLQ